MESHVGQDNDVLAQAKHAVDVRLTIFIVSPIEEEHQAAEYHRDFEEEPLEVDRQSLVAVLRGIARARDQVDDDAHVRKGAEDEGRERRLVDWEILLGRDDGQHQKGEVFDELQDQRRLDQKRLKSRNA